MKAKQLCPVAKLPSELLLDVFIYVVSPSKHERYSTPTLCSPHTPSYLSCASPFSISHVCYAWRAVSLSSPRLWTSLRVVHPKNPKIVSLLSLWLQRSRWRQLDLSLYQPPGFARACVPSDDYATNFDSEAKASREVWQLFLTVMDRWLRVDVNVCINFKSLLIGEPQRDWSAPLALETIRFVLGPCKSGLHEIDTETEILPSEPKHLSDESEFFAYLLHSSPNLRTVEWDNRYTPISFELVVKWPSSLTEITLYGSQDVISILSGLSTCKSLRSLTIFEQTFPPHLAHHANHHLTPPISSASSRKSSPLILPGLETLRLGSFPHPELLFGNLVVPGLHNLIILRGYNGRRGWRGLTRTSWFTLSEMLTRSLLKNLSTLEIGGVTLDLAELDGPLVR